MAIPAPDNVNNNDNANNHECSFYPMEMGYKKENANRFSYAKIEVVKIKNLDYEVTVCEGCNKLHLHSTAGFVVKHELTLKHVLYDNSILEVPRARSCDCSDTTLDPTYMRIGADRRPLYYRYCEKCNRLLIIEENGKLTDISDLTRPGV